MKIVEMKKRAVVEYKMTYIYLPKQEMKSRYASEKLIKEMKTKSDKYKILTIDYNDNQTYYVNFGLAF